MKNITFIKLLLVFLGITPAFAQVQKAQTLQIGNTSTNAQNTSAALQIDDTSRGFLGARMTTAQRTAIANPANGLQVYDTDTNSLWFYNGTTWVQSASSSSLKFVDGTNPTDAVYTDGNVGIGVLSPKTKLQVNGSTSLGSYWGSLSQWGSPLHEIQNTSSWSNTVSIASDSIGTISSSRLSLIRQTNGSSDLQFLEPSPLGFPSGYAAIVRRGLDYPNVSQRGDFFIQNNNSTILIDQTGNISMGNIFNSQPREQLEVSGAIRIGNTTNATPAAGTIRWNNALQVHDGTAWSNLGIGTSWGTTGTAGTNPTTNFIGTTDNQDLSIRTNNVERVRVNNVGAVSINGSLSTGNFLARTAQWGVATFETINPNTGALIGFRDANTTHQFGVEVGSIGDNFVIRTFGQPRSTFTGTGRLGVGTTAPASRLHIQGSDIDLPHLTLTNFTTGNILNPISTRISFNGFLNTERARISALDVAQNSNRGALTFGTQDNNGSVTEKMRITHNGNVGILTTDPQAELDVNGAIKVGNTAATPVAGMIRFDGTNFQGYNGTTWVQLNN